MKLDRFKKGLARDLGLNLLSVLFGQALIFTKKLVMKASCNYDFRLILKCISRSLSVQNNDDHSPTAAKSDFFNNLQAIGTKRSVIKLSFLNQQDLEH